MRIVLLMVVVCMVCGVGCSNSVEKSAENQKISPQQDEQSREQVIPPENTPPVPNQTVTSNRSPTPRIDNSEWKDWGALTEEQYEEQVEKLSDRLDEIVDEYYEDDDAEDLDRDMLLEKLMQDLPEHMRYNLPEEVIEEIEWWAD